MARSQSQNLDAIHKGQVARIAKAETEELIEARVQNIISKCVGKYHSGKLDGEEAKMAFAGIAELRSLLLDLDTRIGEGVRASDEEIGGQRPQ